MKKSFCLLTFIAFFQLLISLINPLQAQDNPTNDSLRNNALNVFINCPNCDMDYVKKEIAFINYMRDKGDAQLYVLITSMNTGSGGQKFSIYFIGQKEFTGKNDTLTFSSSPNDTDDKIRKEGVRLLKLGLMQYVARTPLAKEIQINYLSNAYPGKVVDPWKSWVFNINGSGYFQGQQSIHYTSVYGYAEATRITEDLKLDFYISNSFNKTIYKLDDTTTVTSLSVSKSFYGLCAKSLGEHWTAGGTLHLNTSTYNNIRFQYSLYPAIEYDLFKYSDATRRQLRFLYELGGGHNEYIDTTIYGKVREYYPLHALTVAYKVVETWGTVSASLYGSQYLHNLSKNSLSLYTSIDVRIFKGLSVKISGDVTLQHDQLSLPKAGATEQEILTQQRQLASQYSYYSSIGLTYTFGSIYNNVVNPRFGN